MIVFISHGVVKEDAEGCKFLDHLYQTLNSQPDHLEAFLDRQRLEEGYEWRTALHEMLASCGAGVLVLSQRAIGRDWVKKEATILSWRRALPVDPRFRLHVVKIEDLGDKELESQGLGPLQLTEIQAWSCNVQQPEDVARVVNGIKNDLENLANSVSCIEEWTPLDKLRTYLEKRLAALDITDLKNLAKDMLAVGGDSLCLAVMDSECRRSCADKISSALLKNDFGKIGSLKTFMERLELLNLSQEVRHAIFGAVAPLWVEPHLAAKFHPQLEPHQADRTAFIELTGVKSTLIKYTLGMLVRRANLRPQRPRVIRVSTPKEWTDDILVQEIGNQIVEQAGENLRGDFDDNELLEHLLAREDPIYVQLNFKMDEEQVEILRDKLRGAIFVVTAQSQLGECASEFRWRKVESLEAEAFASKKNEWAEIKDRYGFYGEKYD